MEAGYDYLLLRGRLRRRFLNISGIFVFVIGAMLLATSGAYYGYTAKARADLGTLNVPLPDPAAGQDVETLHLGPVLPEELSWEVPAGQSGRASQPVPAGMLLGSGSGAAEPTEAVAQALVEPTSVAAATASLPEGSVSVAGLSRQSWVYPASSIASQQLFPGESLSASFWSSPLSYESASYREGRSLQGFTPVAAGAGLPVGGGTNATRLTIPSIGVDSRVSELRILNRGGGRAYETPNNVVGHLPERANTGEKGSAWFFGHTESPVLGEGSVFFNLTKIPAKLHNGEEVFLITYNGERQYLYRLTSSRVVHQRNMELYDTGQATIHLVSCVPRLVYDHRLIVSGELVGQK